MTDTFKIGPEHGSNADALERAGHRHPGVRDALLWLTFRHLPERLQAFSRPFYEAACELIVTIETDSPELTTALNKLVEAKDSAVRAGIKHNEGQAGSIPRPQAVVDPPQFTELTNPPEAGGSTVPRIHGRTFPEPETD